MQSISSSKVHSRSHLVWKILSLYTIYHMQRMILKFLPYVILQFTHALSIKAPYRYPLSRYVGISHSVDGNCHADILSAWKILLDDTFPIKKMKKSSCGIFFSWEYFSHMKHILGEILNL